MNKNSHHLQTGILKIFQSEPVLSNNPPKSSRSFAVLYRVKKWKKAEKANYISF